MINLKQPLNAFFTPKNIILPNKVVSSETSNASEYLDAFLFTINKESRTSNDTDLNSFMSENFGITIELSGSSLNSNFKSLGSDYEFSSIDKTNQKIISNSFSSLFEILKTVNSFNDDQTKKYNLVGKPSSLINKNIDTYDITNRDSQIIKNVSKFSDTSEKNDFLQLSPPQVKRLIFNGDLQNDSGATLPEGVNQIINNLTVSDNYCYFIYRVQTISKLEVLTGYEEKNGIPQLHKPIWGSEDNQVGILSRNSISFCRLVPYENEDYGVMRDKVFDLPTYNEYFFIGV